MTVRARLALGLVSALVVLGARTCGRAATPAASSSSTPGPATPTPATPGAVIPGPATRDASAASERRRVTAGPVGVSSMDARGGARPVRPGAVDGSGPGRATPDARSGGPADSSRHEGTAAPGRAPRVEAAPQLPPAPRRAPESGPVPPATPQEADESEATVLEVVVPDLPVRLLDVMRRDTTAWLPVREMAELLGFEAPTASEGGRVWRLRDVQAQRELVLDVAAGTLRRAGRVVASWTPAPSAAGARPNLLVPTPVLKAMFGVQGVVDWSTATLHLDGAETVPAVLRLRRAARYRQLLAGQGEQAYSASLADLLRGVAPRGAGPWRLPTALGLDYTLSMPVVIQSRTPGTASPWTGQVSGSADVGGGLLTFGSRAPIGRAVGVQRRPISFASWAWASSTPRFVRQVRVGRLSLGGVGSGLGTGLGGGLGGGVQAVNGVSLSNAPYTRTADGTTVSYGGTLAPGWTVEAYQWGVLAAVDSTDGDGRWTVRLPVSFGENPVEVIAYGPGGERRTLSAQYRLPAQTLRPGQWEYDAGAGSCAVPGCAAVTDVRVRRGLSRQLGLAAGATGYWLHPGDLARTTTRTPFVAGATAGQEAGPGAMNGWSGRPDALTPYVLVTATPSGGVALDALAMARSAARLALRLDPSPRWHLSAEANAYAPRGLADSSTASTRGWQWGGWEPAGSGAAVRPLPWQGVVDRRRDLSVAASGRPAWVGRERMFLDLSLVRVERPLSTSTVASGAASVQLGGTLLTPYVRHTTTRALGYTEASTPTTVGLRTQGSLQPNTAALQSLRGLYLSASAEAEAGRFARAHLGLMSPVRSRLQSGLTADWVAGRGTPSVGFQVTLDRSRLRVATSEQRGLDGTTTSLHLITGAATWDARRGDEARRVAPADDADGSGADAATSAGGAGWHFRPYSLGPQGGIRGTAYQDENGDGQRGPREPGVSGIRLLVEGGASMGQGGVTDQDGDYAIHSVAPFELVRLRVDTAYGVDPDLVPASPVTVVSTTAGWGRTVDVPFVRASSIAGTVRRSGGGVGGGTSVIALDRQTRVAVGTLTDAQGQYVFGSLSPGTYTVFVAPSVRDRHDGTPAVPANSSTPVVITPRSAGMSVEGVDLTVGDEESRASGRAPLAARVSDRVPTGRVQGRVCDVATGATPAWRFVPDGTSPPPSCRVPGAHHLEVVLRSGEARVRRTLMLGAQGRVDVEGLPLGPLSLQGPEMPGMVVTVRGPETRGEGGRQQRP